MPHNHSHINSNEPHNHIPSAGIGKAFVIGMILNLAFVLVELIYGYSSHALSLVADAWHNLGDVAGLAISLFAIKMAGIQPNKIYTYGYSKGTILASLANSVLLLLAIGSIGFEAINRFNHPISPQWETISIVAAIGLLVNTVTALLFLNGKELNTRSAFLHMTADAAVSAAVVLSGFLINWTHQTWIDPVISIIICLVILRGTWSVLKQSFKLSLDGVPDDVNVDSIKQAALRSPFVKDIHHLHIWAMSTTKNALTAHLTLSKSLDENESAALKDSLKHELLHLNIQHATLELELHHTDDCEEC
jgi:cobalt-zinc-cadmium efflux system protein